MRAVDEKNYTNTSAPNARLFSTCYFHSDELCLHHRLDQMRFLLSTYGRSVAALRVQAVEP